MELGLSGKVALVTGGSRGIGRATALTLAREGCRVAICARGEESLNRTLAELATISPRCWGCVADVTQAEQVERFVSGAAETLGGVDALICNVGGTAGGASLEATDEEWLTTFDLNLLHVVRTIRAAAPYLKQRDQSRVVMVSSISGWKPGPKAQYGAAKAAEIFLASSLAWELSPYHISVNTVCPGSIYFPGSGWAAFEQASPEDYARFLEQELPEKRLGSDQEVADVITFLVSERARWINGAMIPVDGAQGRPTGRWFDPSV
jgi:3-oxoacyl-[acyl-carrier protein] reductase